MTTRHASSTTAWPGVNNGRRRRLCDLEMLRPRINRDRQQCSYHFIDIDGVTQPLQRISRPLNVRVVGKPRNCASAAAERSDQSRGWPNVVDRLQCGDCEQAYLGETGRTACARVIEHASYVMIKNEQLDMSAAAEHAIFEQESLDFDGVEVIDCELHGVKRRVKEAIHINAEKHCMNKDKRLELNPFWFSLFP